MFPGYYHIGKIYKKFSFKGEVLIKIRKEIPDIFNLSEPVFIAIGGSPVPFFMEKISWQKPDVLRVLFEDFEHESDAEKLIKKDVYVPRERLPQSGGLDFLFDEITGYAVIDKNYGPLGELIHVNDSSPQIFLEVENEEGVLFIPAKAFIRNIDHDKRIVEVEVPEGLTEFRM